MIPNRHIASLMILILTLIVIHGLIAMSGRYSLSRVAEKVDTDEIVLGTSTDQANKNKFHEVSVFYHRFFVPN